MIGPLNFIREVRFVLATKQIDSCIFANGNSVFTLRTFCITIYMCNICFDYVENALTKV